MVFVGYDCCSHGLNEKASCFPQEGQILQIKMPKIHPVQCFLLLLPPLPVGLVILGFQWRQVPTESRARWR